MSYLTRTCIVFGALQLAVLAACPIAVAYVVVENIDSGQNELYSATGPTDSDQSRATGDLDEYQVTEIANGWNYRPSSRKGSDNSRANGRGRVNGFQSRMPRSNRSGLGGGGGGGGGGGRSRASRLGRGMRQGGGQEIVQKVVSVNDPSTAGNSGADDAGQDISLFDSGQGDYGSQSDADGGIADSGAGGGGGAGFGGGGGGPGSSVVSGTPEPTAIAIWAVLGCCGIGFLRYRSK